MLPDDPRGRRELCCVADSDAPLPEDTGLRELGGISVDGCEDEEGVGFTAGAAEELLDWFQSTIVSSRFDCSAVAFVSASVDGTPSPPHIFLKNPLVGELLEKHRDELIV